MNTEKLAEVIENLSEVEKDESFGKIKEKERVYLPDSRVFSPKKEHVLYPKHYGSLAADSIKKEKSFGIYGRGIKGIKGLS